MNFRKLRRIVAPLLGLCLIATALSGDTFATPDCNPEVPSPHFHCYKPDDLTFLGWLLPEECTARGGSPRYDGRERGPRPLTDYEKRLCRACANLEIGTRVRFIARYPIDDGEQVIVDGAIVRLRDESGGGFLVQTAKADNPLLLFCQDLWLIRGAGRPPVNTVYAATSDMHIEFALRKRYEFLSSLLRVGDSVRFVSPWGDHPKVRTGTIVRFANQTGDPGVADSGPTYSPLFDLVVRTTDRKSQVGFLTRNSLLFPCPDGTLIGSLRLRDTMCVGHLGE